MKLNPKKLLAVLLMTGLVAASASCGGAGKTHPDATSLTVLELGTTYGAWNSLDPLTDTTADVNHDLMNSIYGELFQEGTGGSVVPDLATGYQIVDHGLQIKIDLRQNASFSDGSPFDAAAVTFNLDRDFEESAVCLCSENFAAVSSVDALNRTTVALHLRYQDPSIIDAFVDEAPNWIVSPAALSKLGDKAFELNPVGAGPFTVASDILSSKLVLRANPRYWQSGYPKLRSLTFLSVANDTSAYETLVADQAEVYMDLGTPALLAEMRRRFNVVAIPATQTEAINFNPDAAPFDNILAREAVYYATNAPALNQHIFQGAGSVSESPSGPGDRFWTPAVADYRTYNPTAARTLVKKLGGLSFTLSTIDTPLQVPLVEAEQSLLAQVGIRAKISVVSIPQIIKETEKGSVQALATEVGNFDPGLLPGLAASYSSTGPFSLVKDSTLDRLISAAGAQSDPAVASVMYKNIYTYLSTQAYAPFLFTANLWNVTSRSVRGIEPNASEVAWQNVSNTGSG